MLRMSFFVSIKAWGLFLVNRRIFDLPYGVTLAPKNARYLPSGLCRIIQRLYLLLHARAFVFSISLVILCCNFLFSIFFMPNSFGVEIISKHKERTTLLILYMAPFFSFVEWFKFLNRNYKGMQTNFSKNYMFWVYYSGFVIAITSFFSYSGFISAVGLM